MSRQLEPREIDARCVAGCCVYVLRSRGVSTTGAARRSPAANATRIALRAGPALTMQAGVSGALFLWRGMQLVTVDRNQGKAPT